VKEYNTCDTESQKVNGCKLQPQELRKKLVFELNRSGLYVDMKEKLRESMLSIAREKFAAESSSDIVSICSPLYAFMLDEIHAILNQTMGVHRKVSDHEEHCMSAKLVGIAAECEMQGDVVRAKALHEQRYASSKSFLQCNPCQSLALNTP
jgi:hypothetical protein